MYRGNRTAASLSRGVEAFASGLRDHGYQEGNNLVIEWRFTTGQKDEVLAHARDLATLNLELIVAGPDDDVIGAVVQVNPGIPVIMVSVRRPERFVLNLSKPGGMITGTASPSPTATTSKQLEILHSAMPKLSRVALLLDANVNTQRAYLEDIQKATAAMAISIVPIWISRSDQLEAAFKATEKARVGALVIAATPSLTGMASNINRLALNIRLPTLYYNFIAVEAGGFMSYGPDTSDQLRSIAADYADKILKGAKPGDLPVQMPTKLLLVINRRTAQAIGLAIPQELLLRADRVIE